MSDWRLQGQQKFLSAALLLKRPYRKFREGWDHDHCEFCGAKFSELPQDLNVGYSTVDNYCWVCEKCYDDFKEEFQWKEGSPSDQTS
jgi:hypothetical protein